MRLLGMEINFSAPQQIEPSDEDIDHMNRFEEILDAAEHGGEVDKMEFLNINRALHTNGWHYRHRAWEQER
jgi:hypothetical protein